MLLHHYFKPLVNPKNKIIKIELSGTGEIAQTKERRPSIADREQSIVHGDRGETDLKKIKDKHRVKLASLSVGRRISQSVCHRMPKYDSGGEA